MISKRGACSGGACSAGGSSLKPSAYGSKCASEWNAKYTFGRFIGKTASPVVAAVAAATAAYSASELMSNREMPKDGAGKYYAVVDKELSRGSPRDKVAFAVPNSSRAILGVAAIAERIGIEVVESRASVGFPLFYDAFLCHDMMPDAPGDVAGASLDPARSSVVYAVMSDCGPSLASFDASLPPPKPGQSADRFVLAMLFQAFHALAVADACVGYAISTLDTLSLCVDDAGELGKCAWAFRDTYSGPWFVVGPEYHHGKIIRLRELAGARASCSGAIRLTVGPPDDPAAAPPPSVLAPDGRPETALSVRVGFLHVCRAISQTSMYRSMSDSSRESAAVRGILMHCARIGDLLSPQGSAAFAAAMTAVESSQPARERAERAVAVAEMAIAEDAALGRAPKVSATYRGQVDAGYADAGFASDTICASFSGFFGVDRGGSSRSAPANRQQRRDLAAASPSLPSPSQFAMPIAILARGGRPMLEEESEMPLCDVCKRTAHRTCAVVCGGTRSGASFVPTTESVAFASRPPRSYLSPSQQQREGGGGGGEFGSSALDWFSGALATVRALSSRFATGVRVEEPPQATATQDYPAYRTLRASQLSDASTHAGMAKVPLLCAAGSSCTRVLDAAAYSSADLYARAFSKSRGDSITGAKVVPVSRSPSASPSPSPSSSPSAASRREDRPAVQRDSDILKKYFGDYVEYNGYDVAIDGRTIALDRERGPDEVVGPVSPDGVAIAAGVVDAGMVLDKIVEIETRQPTEVVWVEFGAEEKEPSTRAATEAHRARHFPRAAEAGKRAAPSRFVAPESIESPTLPPPPPPPPIEDPMLAKTRPADSPLIEIDIATPSLDSAEINRQKQKHRQDDGGGGGGRVHQVSAKKRGGEWIVKETKNYRWDATYTNMRNEIAVGYEIRDSILAANLSSGFAATLDHLFCEQTDEIGRVKGGDRFARRGKEYAHVLQENIQGGDLWSALHGIIPGVFDDPRTAAPRVLSALFQVMHALDTARNVLAFRHNDLHAGNVRFQVLDGSGTAARSWLFRGPGGWYSVPPLVHGGVRFAMIDMGRAAIDAYLPAIRAAVSAGRAPPAWTQRGPDESESNYRSRRYVWSDAAPIPNELAANPDAAVDVRRLGRSMISLAPHYLRNVQANPYFGQRALTALSTAAQSNEFEAPLLAELAVALDDPRAAERYDRYSKLVERLRTQVGLPYERMGEAARAHAAYASSHKLFRDAEYVSHSPTYWPAQASKDVKKKCAAAFFNWVERMSYSVPSLARSHPLTCYGFARSGVVSLVSDESFFSGGGGRSTRLLDEAFASSLEVFAFGAPPLVPPYASACECCGWPIDPSADVQGSRALPLLFSAAAAATAAEPPLHASGYCSIVCELVESGKIVVAAPLQQLLVDP
jgi:hypothetical protein